MEIERDLSQGIPDEEDANNSGSFILGTMMAEKYDNEKVRAVVQQLLSLSKTVHSELTLRLDTDDAQFKREVDRARLECPESLRVCGKAYEISKACEVVNKSPLVMNLVNQFSEIRIYAHYIEILKRQSPLTVWSVMHRSLTYTHSPCY